MHSITDFAPKQSTSTAQKEDENQHNVAFSSKHTLRCSSHSLSSSYDPPGAGRSAGRFAGCESIGKPQWAMILLAYKHGLRASEICNLRLDHLDLVNGSILIERLKGSLRTTQAITEHRGEPLLNEVRALREWLRERCDDGSDFLFTSQKGGRLDRSQFFRLFRTIAASVGLAPEKRHPHALKHSIANHLILANVNLALVKQQLGHKSIGSTMRYVNTSDLQASKATACALMKIY